MPKSERAFVFNLLAIDVYILEGLWMKVAKPYSVYRNVGLLSLTMTELITLRVHVLVKNGAPTQLLLLQ